MRDAAIIRQQAKVLQAAAKQVMTKLQLLERWRSVGQPVLVGAARFGAMTSPNLDFEIYTDQPTVEAGFAVIQQLAAEPGVEQVQFINFMQSGDPGLYWRVDYRDETGRLWDMDLWLVPFSHPHAGMAERLAEALEQQLTPERLDAVLAIKAARQPEDGLRGVDIYKAVFCGGVRTRQECLAWLAQHPAPEMETWHPS